MKFKLLYIGSMVWSLFVLFGINQHALAAFTPSFNCESTPGYKLTDGVCLPDPNETTGLSKDATVTAVVLKAVRFILQFLGSLAVLMIIVGGLMYMTSAGDDRKIDTAKNLLTYAIYGLVIALLAYVIVYVLSKALGVINH